MKTHTTKDQAGLVFQYLINQTNERPIAREFTKGYAIQRCISGCYWDFDANRWDNGCDIGDRSDWEKRHNLLMFLED